MGRIKNKDLYLLKYLPQATDYVVGSDEENNGETVNFELGALTALVQNYGQSDRIISGKAIWIPGTLSFYIQEIEYYLRGEFHTTDPITITLATADPSNPRKDVIAVTIDEEVYVETGTPSPNPAKPTLPNGTDYLELTFVDIAAGAIIPTGAEYETIYANFLGEPIEWTTTENTGGLRIILNDDVFVNSSPVSISILSPNDGDTITFTNDSPFVLDPNDNFQFYVRSPHYLSTIRTFGSLKIRFYKSGSPVSNYITLKYPTSNSISTFYPVSVALDKFTFSDTSYDRVDIEMYGIDFDFKIDDVGIVRNINDPLDGDFVPTGGYEGTGQDLYTLIYNHINDTTIHFTQAQISITESQISDLQAYLLTEIDPIFGAHTVSNIVNGTGRLTNDGAGNWSYDNNSYSLVSHTHSLIDLTDVNTSTPTNRNVLVADGIDWESRLLVEADISDLQNYALESSLIIPNTEIVFGTGTGITSSFGLKWDGSGLLSLGTIAAAGNLFGANLHLSSANPDIAGNDVDGDLSIYASTASLSGGEIKLYGESHTTKANDIEFLSNGIIKGNWDNSANLWTLTGNLTVTGNTNTANLELSASNPFIIGNDVDGVLSITPDISILAGSGFKLYGSTHLTKANDIEFTSDNSVIGSWDNSANLWSFIGRVSISTLDAATLDTDKFLVSDGGVIKFRTGAELLSDIGGSSSSHTHALIDLTDVNTSTPTNRNVLVADGVDWESRLLVEADISDLQAYSLSSHNHTLDSLSNVTITSNSAGEILKWSGTAWINNTLAEAGIAATGDIQDWLRADVADIKTGGNLVFNDNIRIAFGSLSGESSLYSDATNTLFDLVSGDLVIRDTTTQRFTFGRTTGNFTNTGNITAQGSNIEVGKVDEVSGKFIANGVGIGGGTIGGTLWLRLAADHDTTIDRFQIAVSADDLLIGSNIDTDLLKYDGTNNYWLFNHDGNVGIGTTTPTYKLDVTGTGRFTDDVTAESFGGALTENAAVTTTYNIDWKKSTYHLTLTGNTTISESNLPATGFTKTMTIYMTGNFIPTFPANWINNLQGSYAGTVLNQIVIEYVKSGVYWMTINQAD